jgi:hypothetical protein
MLMKPRSNAGLFSCPLEAPIDRPQRPILPSLRQEIVAILRRRFTCPCCGGRGLIVGEITGRRGIPDEWEVSCWAGCGERWWIPKEQG